MKILYVNTVGVWGGVATYLYALINDQVYRNNKVYLLVGTKGSLTYKIHNKLPSVKIIILPTLKRDIHIIDTFKAIFQFRNIVKEINPDIIHLNCIMSGIVGRLGCIGLHEEIVYNAHGWVFDHGVSKKFKWPAIIIEKLLAYLTDKIICVSDYEYKVANKYHIFKNKNQGIVIKNGAPTVHMKPSPKLKDDVFRITMAARFCRQKDQPDLIRAFAILVKELLPNKKIKLYLLGDGFSLNYCKKLAVRLNVYNNVIFTGAVNNVLYYYNGSDVVALITHYEGMPIDLIEALSLGKPIIASNVCGVSEMFNYNGYYVKNDSRIIAQSLSKLVRNKSLRKQMSINSSKLFDKSFNINDNIKRHDILYRRLLR